MTYDPAFMNRPIAQLDYLHRPARRASCSTGATRSNNWPRIATTSRPRISSSSASSRPHRSRRPGASRSRCTPCFTENVRSHGGLPVRRASDGHLPEHSGRCRPSTLTRQDFRQGVGTRQTHRSSRRCRASPPMPPPHRRRSVYLPGQRPQLHRQLPEHAIKMPAEKSTRTVLSSPGRAVHSACRPRAGTAAREPCGTSGARMWIVLALAGASAALYVHSHGGPTRPCSGC